MEQRIEIIPGIGASEKTFHPIQMKVNQVCPYVDWIQIDICDGLLVPNTTFLDSLPFSDLIKKTGKNFELHMMVEDPFLSVKSWIKSGFKRIYFHFEGISVISHYELQISNLKKTFPTVEFGIAIDKQTRAEAVLPVIDLFDCVLIMTIQAGFSGQKFIPEMLEKVKTIHGLKPTLPIEVDGGINDETAKLAVEAGAKRLITTSYLFNSENIAGAIQKLKMSIE